jgi:hypothetical protein
MPQYIIVYLGGNQPSDPEESKKNYTKYKEWLASLGDTAVSPANPFKHTSTVNPDGSISTGSSTAMSGYTILEADSMEKALEIARAPAPFWTSAAHWKCRS